MKSHGNSVSIVLFRNDLRLHDNLSLFMAMRSSADHILPVYCFDKRQYDIEYVYGLKSMPTEPSTYVGGFVKSGIFKTRFLVESVLDLSKNLSRRNCPMLICSGHTESVMTSLVAYLKSQSMDIKGIFVQKEISSEELDVEKAILANCNAKMSFFWNQTMISVDDLPYNIGQLPNTFTDFRKTVERNGCISTVKQTYPSADGTLKHSLNALLQGFMRENSQFFPHKSENFSFVPVPREDSIPDSRGVYLPGGESMALSRVEHYLNKHIHEYKETRNGLVGLDYSSKFSPYLALGTLGPRYLYWKLKEKESTDPEKYQNGCYWMIFELLWRDYFKFVGLKWGNKIFQIDGISGKSVEWNIYHDEEVLERFLVGKTGIPFVDAGMRELMLTGFMSNRIRQNVASFFVHSLKMDWRIGACWMESCLIDYDIHSNYGNWMYLAGVGTDPRVGRKFNMMKQALDYDSDGNYVKLWCRELEGEDHFAPWLTLPQTVWPHPILIEPEWKKFIHSAQSKKSKKSKKTGWNLKRYY